MKGGRPFLELSGWQKMGKYSNGLRKVTAGDAKCSYSNIWANKHLVGGLTDISQSEVEMRVLTIVGELEKSLIVKARTRS